MFRLTRRGFVGGIVAACGGLVLPKVPAIEIVTANWKPSVFRIGFGGGHIQGHDASEIFDLLYFGLDQIQTQGLLKLQRCLADPGYGLVFNGLLVDRGAVCPMVAALPDHEVDNMKPWDLLKSGRPLSAAYARLGITEFDFDPGAAYDASGPCITLTNELGRLAPAGRITNELGDPTNTYCDQLRLAQREGTTEVVDQLLRDRRNEWRDHSVQT